MSVTHYVPAEKLEKAQTDGIGALLFLRPVCGARATVRAQLSLLSDPGRVSCKRCAAAMAKAS